MVILKPKYVLVYFFFFLALVFSAFGIWLTINSVPENNQLIGILGILGGVMILIIALRLKGRKIYLDASILVYGKRKIPLTNIQTITKSIIEKRNLDGKFNIAGGARQYVIENKKDESISLLSTGYINLDEFIVELSKLSGTKITEL